jgi:hypothetical protein
MASITNWVSNDTNVGAVRSAQVILEQVKRVRYAGKGKNFKQYRLVKIGDHPLTYREELITDEKK